MDKWPPLAIVVVVWATPSSSFSSPSSFKRETAVRIVKGRERQLLSDKESADMMVAVDSKEGLETFEIEVLCWSFEIVDVPCLGNSSSALRILYFESISLSKCRHPTERPK
jgi:hypothetical protein